MAIEEAYVNVLFALHVFLLQSKMRKLYAMAAAHFSSDQQLDWELISNPETGNRSTVKEKLASFTVNCEKDP